MPTAGTAAVDRQPGHRHRTAVPQLQAGLAVQPSRGEEFGAFIAIAAA
ncbi:hypothetical protein [Actinoplanes sp. NPDC023714]